MREQGVTSFLDAAGQNATVETFAEVQRAGGLTARAHFAVPITAGRARSCQGRRGGEGARAQYDQGPDVAAPTITVRNIKLFLDGVITCARFTGAMLEPYFTNQGTRQHRTGPRATNAGRTFTSRPDC